MIDFEFIWNQYPSKDGKKRALKSFNASVKTEMDWLDINLALENYKRHLKLNPWKHPKNGSTWFQNWDDWVSWEEPKKQPSSMRAYEEYRHFDE